MYGFIILNINSDPHEKVREPERDRGRKGERTWHEVGILCWLFLYLKRRGP